MVTDLQNDTNNQGDEKNKNKAEFYPKKIVKEDGKTIEISVETKKSISISENLKGIKDLIAVLKKDYPKKAKKIKELETFISSNADPIIDKIAENKGDHDKLAG